MLTYYLHLGFSSGRFPLGVSTKVISEFLISDMRATWPAPHIILDLTT
jgi:hypothetical protein